MAENSIESTMSVSEFRNRCLELLKEISLTKIGLILTRRGTPIAKLVPISGEPKQASLIGSVRYESEDDLLSPEDEHWDAEA